MGQQQLLLLVLGIVIVGLAVIVGINAFGENDKKSNADAMVTDALRIASDCQAWELKPAQVGGALDIEGLSQCTFGKIGYPTSGGTTYTNVNGEFSLAAGPGSGCAVNPTAPSGQTVLVVVEGYNEDRGNRVCVGIAGTNTNDVGTSVDFNAL